MGNRQTWLWPLAAWTVFTAIALWLTHGVIQLDTDSAMRLVQVRDLLHGQSWFDTVQHRMNTPYGLSMLSCRQFSPCSIRSFTFESSTFRHHR